MSEQKGMFGASGTGDTSGYGGLERASFSPTSAQRPFGSYFDDVADELEKEALKLATKKMAVRRGVMLTVPEMVDLLIRFVQQGEENRSPDGRKIFFVTDFEWMLKQLE